MRQKMTIFKEENSVCSGTKFSALRANNNYVYCSSEFFMGAT